MSFQRYMAMALYEPGFGYYVNGLHKFGAAGDFVTAPEHGRLFALALARQLEPLASRLGKNWTLMEPGPGSGSLARDVLSHIKPESVRLLVRTTNAKTS